MSSVAGSELGGRHDAAAGVAEGLINLGAAAKLVPGRVSTHCLWRWCRRGIQARSGERVHLEHVRLGGRVYTRADWIIAFGKRLAETDAAHYDRRATASPSQPEEPHAERRAQVDRDLEAAGL